MDAETDAVCQAFIHGEFQTGRVKHLIHIGAYLAWGEGMDFEQANMDDPWVQNTYAVTDKSLFEDTIEIAYYPECPLTLDQPVVIHPSAVTKYLSWPTHEDISTTEKVLNEWIAAYETLPFANGRSN